MMSVRILGYFSLLLFRISLGNSSESASGGNTASGGSGETLTAESSSIVESANYEECISLIAKGRYSVAIPTCQKAIGELNQKDSRLNEVLLHLADAQEQNGNPWQTLSALQRIVDNPESSSISLEKANIKFAKIYKKFGNFEFARKAAGKVEQQKVELLNEIEKSQKLYDEIKNSMKEKKWEELEFKARDFLIEHCNYFGEVYDMRIKALLNLKDIQRAIDAARSKARIETDSSETDFLIGKLYLSSGNITTGRKFITECAKLNPENKKCLALRSKLKSIENTLEEIDHKMLLKEAVTALEELKSLVDSAPKTEIYYDENFPNLFEGFRVPVIKLLCTKLARRKLVDEAVKTCEEGMKLDPNHSEIYLIRLGELYLSQQKYDEASDYLRQAQAKSPRNEELRELLQKAEKQKREKARTKYYETLGVARDATEDQIKKAYNHLVRKFHPDKQSDEDSKKKAQLKMHEINNAYDVLSDQKKRQQYDAGFDPNDPNAGQQGFGGGNPFAGGNPFGGGGGGGSGSYHFNMDDLADLFGGGGRKRKQHQQQQRRDGNRQQHHYQWNFHDDL